MDIKEIQEKVVKISDTYAKNYWINRTDDWYILKLQEELGELTQNYLSFTSRGRDRWKSENEIKKEFAYELSDLIGQTLLIANHFDIDIEKALEDKWYKYL